MQVILGTRITPPVSLEKEGLYIQVLPSSDRVLWRRSRFAYLHALQATLVLSLLGGAASSADLIDALWGADPEGGPAWDLPCLRQVVWRTRTALEPLGLGILHRRGAGYSLEDLADVPGEEGEFGCLKQ